MTPEDLQQIRQAVIDGIYEVRKRDARIKNAEACRQLDQDEYRDRVRELTRQGMRAHEACKQARREIEEGC